MTCEQAELRMAELLAGEIAPAEREALEQHLLDCGACRGDFELARAGARVDWADVPVPKEVLEATLASFREPPAAVRLLRWATAAAAVFGVAVLLLTSSRGRRPASCPIAEPRAERREVLATMQEAVVGALVCKDEDGRPVGELGLRSHDVSVEILDGIAKTTVEENFENPTDRRLEGTFTFPLPSDASISRLALEVNGKIEEGTCLERERAREVFESIVRRMQDPALLEWQPGGFFKCRVFPIEPRSTKRVIVAYTQALPCFRGKMSYVYPLASEKTRTHPPEEVRISVRARFSGALAKIESPSHRLDVQRKNANEASMSFRAANYRPNNDFVVTMEPADEELRVVSHRPDGEDGYFACFLTPRGGAERAPGRYAFVLDASASTSAPRLEVARRLVRAMMERRIPGDRFEILAHNVEVERSGEVDLRRANDFMDRLRPIGGSDVLKALLAADAETELIYIGKGSPSFGESDPAKILEAVKGRRIRTIAVGSDANGLLLEKLGGMMRVSPNDDVDKRVAEIAATIGSPVLSELKVEGEGIAEVVGARDLFYGERLVVSGRYREGATKLRITGRGYRRELDVAFPAKEEGNNYVRRLWAQRQAADLLALGESSKAAVTALGVKYQIMTPYTSFLVLETEQMWKDHQLKREVQKQDEVLSAGDPLRGVLEEATALYKQGKTEDASAKFEQAFAMKPSSDQVSAFIRRTGEDVVARMMNDGNRKIQDSGRRLFDLAKPGEGLREGKATTQKYIEELQDGDHAVWRNSFWHLKHIGPSALNDLLPALSDQTNERYRSRVMLLLTEMGTDSSPDLTDALTSPDSFVRQNAAIVLGNIKDRRTLAALRRRLSDANETEDVKRFVSDAIQKTSRGSAANPEVEGRGERELLFAQAQGSFEREDFVRAAEACDRLLQRYPNLPVVQEMKNLSQRFSHMKRGAEVDLKTLTEGWKREVEQTEFLSIQPDQVKPTPPPSLLPAVVKTPPASAEDPKARAIREAYEEQLRRDRQEVTIQTKNATVDQVVEEFRRQTGWNIILDHKNIPSDLRVDEMRVTKENARAALDAFAVGNGLELDTLSFDGRVNAQSFWLGPQRKLELYDVQDLTYAMADFPGVDITLAQDAVVANPVDLPPVETPRPGLLNEVHRLNRDLNEVQRSNVEGLSKTEEESTVPAYKRPVWTLRRPSPERRELPGTDNSKAARINDPQRELDSDMQSFVRQQEVQLAQIQELTTKLDETRGKLAKSLNEKSLAVAETQYARQLAERLQQDLAQLEEKHVEMARDKMHLEEKINAIAQSGANVNVAPKKALEAKVTAIAPELGLLVISIGKDDGVLEGDEFTVYRGGDFVAKIVIDRSDRKWAAGKVVLKKTEPRVADDVSNHIFVSGPRAGGTVLSGEGERARLIDSGASGVASEFLALTRDSKFVALVRVVRGPGKEFDVQVYQGLAVGRILPGDQATPVADVRAYLESLPVEVRMDLASRSNQQAIRAKMGLQR
jgi:hypothetical protein